MIASWSVVVLGIRELSFAIVPFRRLVLPVGVLWVANAVKVVASMPSEFTTYVLLTHLHVYMANEATIYMQSPGSAA